MSDELISRAWKAIEEVAAYRSGLGQRHEDFLLATALLDLKRQLEQLEDANAERTRNE